MGIAEGMKSLTEDILSSYDARVKTIGSIVADTHRIVVDAHKITSDARKTVKGFTADRKKMASEQAVSLGNFAKGLAQNIDDMLGGFGNARKHMGEEQAKNLEDFLKTIGDFVKNLTRNVGTMMNGFRKEHKEVSEELKGKLAKEAKDIEAYITKLLKDFRASRSEMSETLRKNLDKYIRDIINCVRGIANNTRQLIGEYHSDMSRARHAWQGMAATLAKAKEKGGLTGIGSGEKVATVAQATKKNRQKARKKKTVKVAG